MEKERKQAEAAAFQEMERQRDEEIELVILRLEEEAETVKTKLKMDMEAKISQVTENYQQQLKEAKEAEREVMDKYLSLFKQHSTVDERLRANNEKVIELEDEVARKAQAVARAENALRQSEVDQESRVQEVRNEYNKKLARMQEMLKELEVDQSLLPACLTLLRQDKLRKEEIKVRDAEANLAWEVKELNRKKHLELDEINSKVRTTINKKEEVIQNLTAQVSPPLLPSTCPIFTTSPLLFTSPLTPLPILPVSSTFLSFHSPLLVSGCPSVLKGPPGVRAP
eukprot:760685-Hanusia_phi.AAC.2